MQEHTVLDLPWFPMQVEIFCHIIMPLISLFGATLVAMVVSVYPYHSAHLRHQSSDLELTHQGPRPLDHASNSPVTEA